MRINHVGKCCMPDGLKVVQVWFQGCPHHCVGCHSPETWKTNTGDSFTPKELVLRMVRLGGKMINRIDLLGGEPLAQPTALSQFVDEIRKVFGDIPIKLMTGYSKKEINQNQLFKQITQKVNILKTGRYDKKQQLEIKK